MKLVDISIPRDFEFGGGGRKCPAILEEILICTQKDWSFVCTCIESLPCFGHHFDTKVDILHPSDRSRALLPRLSMEFGEPGPPARDATNASQLASIAELPKAKKYAFYETLTEDNLDPFLKVSCYPITVKAEDDMVSLSC